MSLWPANSRTSCIWAPLRMASLMAVLRSEWTPMPRLLSRFGSMPAARQYFLTSRQGVVRDRCRRFEMQAVRRQRPEERPLLVVADAGA